MIEKLMKFFKVHFSTSLTLKDGTALALEGDLDTGTQVSVVTSDGNIALPDGEYQLEDMTIITVKDGLVMDIIKPGEVEEPTEGLDPMGNPEPEDMATQKENPEVSGEAPQPMDEPLPTTTGTTATEVDAVDVEVEEPEVEVEVNPMEKVAELEAKVAALEEMIKGLVDKMNMNEEKTNMIADKFSAAQPLITKKESEGTIDPKLQNKVDLIKRLRKGNSEF